MESLLIEFEFAGPKLRRLEASTLILDDSVFAPSEAGMKILSFVSRAPVRAGIRVEMKFTTAGDAAIEFEGISRGFGPDGHGNYRVQVALDPMHGDRLCDLRTRITRPSGATFFPQSRISMAPALSLPPDSGPNPPLRLRLRAEDGLLDRITESHDPAEGGTLRIPLRRHTSVGRSVTLEIELGSTSDEVVLAGVIGHARVHGPRSSEALVHIVSKHRHRLSFLAEVMRGRRPPASRSFPRYEVNLKAQIVKKPRTVPAAVQCLSAGGAFVRSYMNPAVGSTLQLGIRLPDEGTIHIAAEVMWAVEHGERVGFGARFLSRSAGSSFSDQGEAVHSIRRYVQSLAPAAEAEWANA